jgi:hypothetical protein
LLYHTQNSLFTCGAMCKMVATGIVPCPELTMHMGRQVQNGGNSLYHTQNSLCTCGATCKMAATHCATRRTWFQFCRPDRLLGPGGILHTNKSSLSLIRIKITVRYSGMSLTLQILAFQRYFIFCHKYNKYNHRRRVRWSLRCRRRRWSPSFAAS